MSRKLLLDKIHVEGIRHYEAYRREGGYRSVEKALKKKQKYGTLYYLAMWQGLRGTDLRIATAGETVVTCTATDMEVVFTNDSSKYGEA